MAHHHPVAAGASRTSGRRNPAETTMTDQAADICGDTFPGMHIGTPGVCVLPPGHDGDWHEAETLDGIPPMRWSYTHDPGGNTAA